MAQIIQFPPRRATLVSKGSVSREERNRFHGIAPRLVMGRRGVLSAEGQELGTPTVRGWEGRHSADGEARVRFCWHANAGRGRSEFALTLTEQDAKDLGHALILWATDQETREARPAR